MSSATPSFSRPPAVLHDMDWGTYTRIRRVFDQRRRGFRHTYDRGTLEIRSPLWEHETAAYMLGCFVNVLTEELSLPCQHGGSVSLRRKRKGRALESYNSYWIANAAKLLGKNHFDLRTDPPPDLAIEMDVVPSLLDRMSIYATLGVPEVWRLTSAELTFHILEAARYQVRTNSLSFPKLRSDDVARFMIQRWEIDNTTLALKFRRWVQEVLVKRPN
jgi:Uma2 family endonuclease